MRHDIGDAPLAHADTDTIRVDSMAVVRGLTRHRCDGQDSVCKWSWQELPDAGRDGVVRAPVPVVLGHVCQSRHARPLSGWRKTLVMHDVCQWVTISAAFKRAQHAWITDASLRWSWTSWPTTWVATSLVGQSVVHSALRDYSVGTRETSTSTTWSRILKLRPFNNFGCWRMFGTRPA